MLLYYYARYMKSVRAQSFGSIPNAVRVYIYSTQDDFLNIGAASATCVYRGGVRG